MKNPIHKLYLFGTIAACLLIVGAIIPSLSKSHSLQSSKPQIENKTQQFQAVSLELNADGDAYELVLKNNYMKPINAYTIGIGPTSRVDVDLTLADRVIASGETTKETIPVSKLQAPNNPNQLSPNITILAVMFSDKTGDGDTKAIQRVKDRHLGAKIQLQRANAVLDAALATSGSITPDTLASIRAQISSLSVEPSQGQSPMVKSGLQSAQRQVLSELEHSEKDNSDLRGKLHKIKDKLGQRLGNL